jgi:hypothetical protein
MSHRQACPTGTERKSHSKLLTPLIPNHLTTYITYLSLYLVRSAGGEYKLQILWECSWIYGAKKGKSQLIPTDQIKTKTQTTTFDSNKIGFIWRPLRKIIGNYKKNYKILASKNPPEPTFLRYYLLIFLLIKGINRAKLKWWENDLISWLLYGFAASLNLGPTA